MQLRVCPPMLFVKTPPTKILPSACTAIDIDTASFAFGLNESANPVVGIEPGDAVARLSADAVAREIAAHQNLAVRLHRDCNRQHCSRSG